MRWDLYTPFWDATFSRGPAPFLLPLPERRPEPPRPISYETFKRIMAEELDLLPRYCFDELTGGVLAEERAMLSPDRVADDLYVLGLYTWSMLGKQVKLFYGSFTEVIGPAAEDVYREKIRETIRHEFRHHMETRAGEFGKGSLLEEDARQKARYYEAHRRRR